MIGCEGMGEGHVKDDSLISGYGSWVVGAAAGIRNGGEGVSLGRKETREMS